MLGINDVSRVPVTQKASLPFEQTKGEIQTPTRGAVYNTAEPGGGHASGGPHEWQRDPMERYDHRLVRSNSSELRLKDFENMLRMTDHLALTRDGIHFRTQQGRRWINDVFQTKIEEMEQEVRTTDSLARTSSTGGGRMGVMCRNHSPVASGPWQ